MRQLLGQRGQRFRRPGPGEDEVVRRRLHCRRDDLVAFSHEPEVQLRIETWRAADRACEPKDQVVARLVREQERLGLGKERRRILEPHDLHYSSSSTSTAPPATRSPSPTWTARTV